MEDGLQGLGGGEPAVFLAEEDVFRLDLVVPRRSGGVESLGGWWRGDVAADVGAWVWV